MWFEVVGGVRDCSVLKKQHHPLMRCSFKKGTKGACYAGPKLISAIKSLQIYIEEYLTSLSEIQL